MHILYLADAAPINLIAQGLIKGLRASGHELLTYGPGLKLFYSFDAPVARALELLNHAAPMTT